MRNGVLKQRDLQSRADRLRRAFSAGEDGPDCLFLEEDEGPYPSEAMDARARKLAARKLLRPVDAGSADLMDGFSEPEILEVHQQYWSIVVGHSGQENVIDRAHHRAEQYAQSKTFVCAAWKMDPGALSKDKIDTSACGPAGESVGEEDGETLQSVASGPEDYEFSDEELDSMFDSLFEGLDND